MNTPEQVVIRNHFRIIDRSDDDDAERLITGIVADPENIDSYGQIIDAHVVRKMALNFMERHGDMGTDHAKDDDGNPIVLNDDIVIVENWVTRNKDVIGGEKVPQGAWMLTVRVLSDEIWERVVDGELNGYSFEAIVWRINIEDDDSIDEAVSRMEKFLGRSVEVINRTKKCIQMLEAA